MASIQLRALIDSILADISRDMREQADVVETEFARRISEMSDAMQKMIHNMREVKKTKKQRDLINMKKKIDFLFRH
jgi:methyl-accepting chemotaxis protein